MAGLDRILAPIKRKIFLIIGRAIVSAIDNTGNTQRVQLQLLAEEIASKVERFEEYGFSTYPFEGSQALSVFINGDRAHGVILCIHDRRYRPTNLSEGEVIIYTDEDKENEFRIWLKRNRIMYMAMDKLQAEVNTLAYINSPEITLGSDTRAAVRRLIDQRFKDLFNTHVHSGVLIGGANTAVSTTQLSEASHMTDITRAL